MRGNHRTASLSLVGHFSEPGHRQYEETDEAKSDAIVEVQIS